MIIDELCERLMPLAGELKVADARIGLGYTGVLLENGRCGLAYTFRNGAGAGCCVMKQAGSICGSQARELAESARSHERVVAALGVATLNALRPEAPVSDGDILDHLAIAPTDTVGMIGFFGPLVEPLRKMAKCLHIFEQNTGRAPGVHAEDEEAALLPECQVVIVSATTLLNGTLDAVLAHARGAREIALLGPTTPLVPDVFAPHGITILSGVEVTDPQLALRVLSEGGGTPQLGKATRKVSLRINY